MSNVFDHSSASISVSALDPLQERVITSKGDNELNFDQVQYGLV